MNTTRVTRKPRFLPSPRRRLRRIGAGLMVLSLLAALKAHAVESTDEQPAALRESVSVVDSGSSHALASAWVGHGETVPVIEPRATTVTCAAERAATTASGVDVEAPAPPPRSTLGIVVALGLMLAALVRQPESGSDAA